VQPLMLTINVEEDEVDEAGRQKGYGKTEQSVLLPLQAISPTSGCSQLRPGGTQATPMLSKGCLCVFYALCPWLLPKCTKLGKPPVKQTVRKASPSRPMNLT
jgi:hypothetical protein